MSFHAIRSPPAGIAASGAIVDYVYCPAGGDCVTGFRPLRRMPSQTRRVPWSAVRRRVRALESRRAVAMPADWRGSRDDISSREHLRRPRIGGGARGAHGPSAQRAGRLSTAAARAARAPDSRHGGLRRAGWLAHRGSRHQLPPHREPYPHGLSRAARWTTIAEAFEDARRRARAGHRCGARESRRRARDCILGAGADHRMRAAGRCGGGRFADRAASAGARAGRPVHDARPCLGSRASSSRDWLESERSTCWGARPSAKPSSRYLQRGGARGGLWAAAAAGPARSSSTPKALRPRARARCARCRGGSPAISACAGAISR